jgi:undecaprenyl-diphosphatase
LTIGEARVIASQSLLERAWAAEARVCIVSNRACHRPAIGGFFASISRLGNGVFWYVLIALLPILYGTAALVVSARMVLVGTVGIVIYKILKAYTGRSRPFSVLEEIDLIERPLDAGSFPSGHTLHAVSFTVIATTAYTELAWLLVPFATLVALSRLVLGLHYPSDVLAGAAIGSAIALATLLL